MKPKKECAVWQNLWYCCALVINFLAEADIYPYIRQITIVQFQPNICYYACHFFPLFYFYFSFRLHVFFVAFIRWIHFIYVGNFNNASEFDGSSFGFYGEARNGRKKCWVFISRNRFIFLVRRDVWIVNYQISSQCLRNSHKWQITNFKAWVRFANNNNFYLMLLLIIKINRT